MQVIRDKVTKAAGHAWKVAKTKNASSFGWTKATTAGAAAVGIVASTAGAKSATLHLERPFAPFHEFIWGMSV